MANRQTCLVVYQAVTWMEMLIGIRKFEYFTEDERFGVTLGWYKEGCWWRWIFLKLTGKFLELKRPVRILPLEDKERFFASQNEKEKHMEDNFVVTHREVDIVCPHL